MTTRGLIWVAALGVAAAMAWLAFEGEEQLAGVVVFGFLSLTGSLLPLRRGSAHGRPLALFLAAFGIRALAAIALYEGGLVSLVGEPDAEVWSWGWAQSEVWHGRLDRAGSLSRSPLGAFSGKNQGYIYLVAALFYLLGTPSRLAAAFLNAFFGAMVAVLAFLIAERLFDRQIARLAGLLAAFFPSLIVWSAQTLKEPAVIFCECLIVYSVIRLRERFSLRHLGYALAAVLLVSTMRFYVAYLALGVISAALVLRRAGLSGRSFAAGLALLAAAVPLLAELGFIQGTSERVQSFDMQFVEHYRDVTSLGPGGGSAVRMEVDMKTPGGAAAATAVGVAHLLLAPFPWQFGRGSLKMLMTLPELLLWWWLFFRGVLPGLVHAIRTRFGAIQPVLLFVVPICLLYGMIFANVGLAFRYRAQLLPFLLVFAAVGLLERRRRRAQRWVARLQASEEAGGRWRRQPRRPGRERTAEPVPRERMGMSV